MLQEIWLIHPEESTCEAFHRRFNGLPRVQVVQSRFEELPPHDCFVTAGNAFGIMTAGIDAAVVQYFGDDLMRNVQFRIMDEFLGEQPIGTAFIIETGNERIPYLAHAPTMRVPGNIAGSDQVYRATWGALLALHRHNLTAERQIAIAAFPAFGTGFGGMPDDESARQMAAAWKHYLTPPHRLDWDFVIDRHRSIAYDGERQVAR